MNRSDFRTLVLAHVQYEAQPYILSTDTTNLNLLINDRLAIFSGMAKAFYDEAIPLTLVQGPATGPQRLNTRDGSAFGSMIWEPLSIGINGAPLVDMDGEPGSISVLDLQTNVPGYYTATRSAPRFWFTSPSSAGVDVALWPPSDQAYPNCWAVGWTMHPALTADSGAGGVTLLPQELERAAAKYVAAALLDPTKAGSSLSRYTQLMQEAQGEALTWAAKTERMIGSRRVRRQMSGVRRLGGG